MDMHNIDDYLNLSQDNTSNFVDEEATHTSELLDTHNTAGASKDLDWDPSNAADTSNSTTQPTQASENILSTLPNSNSHNEAIAAAAAAAAAAVATNAPWFTGLQGIDLSQIISTNGIIAPPVTITPDSLTRPPAPTAAQIQQQLQAARSMIAASTPSSEQEQGQQGRLEQTPDSGGDEQLALSSKEAAKRVTTANVETPSTLEEAKKVKEDEAAVTSTVNAAEDEDKKEDDKSLMVSTETAVKDMEASNSNAEEAPVAVVSDTNAADANVVTISDDSVAVKTTAAAFPTSSGGSPGTANSNNKGTASKKVSPATATKKRKNRRKLYCICQKPYDGEPMVQCDKCKEWYHCECVGFDADDTDDEEGEWICQKCTEGLDENRQAPAPTPTDNQSTVSPTVSDDAIITATTIPSTTTVATASAASTLTRQSRTGRSHQSKCLYAGCQNRTRADSFCSDVCARKHNEELNSTTRSMRRHSSAANRIQSMAGAAAETNTKVKKKTTKAPSKKAVNKEDAMEEEDDDEALLEEDDEKDEDVKMEDLVEEEEDDDDNLDEDEEEEEEDEDEFEFKTEPNASTKAANNKRPKRKLSTSKVKALTSDSKAIVTTPNTEKEGLVEPSPSPASVPEQTPSPEDNPIRRNVVKNMTNILKPLFDVALEKNPEMFVSTPPATAADAPIGDVSAQERAEKLAKTIENTMFEQLCESKGNRALPGERYKSKFRSLLYNLKDKANQVFQLRVVTGDLTPDELVTMSSEDMANPELKSMSEVLRKTALKNSVMKIENMPIIKKTHKGDIIMLPNSKDHHETEESMYSKEVQEELQRINDAAKATSATTTATAASTAMGTEEVGGSGSDTPVSSRSRSASYSRTPTPSDEKRFSFGPNGPAGSKIDPLDAILARFSSNSSDTDSPASANNITGTSKKRSGSLLTPTTEEDLEAKKRKVNEDLEKILGDEDEDTPFVVEDIGPEEEKTAEEDKMEVDDKTDAQEQQDQQQQLPTIWKGRVNMPQVAEFEASARQIGGRLLTDAEWQEVLSSNMWIEGRVRMESVTDYVTQTQYSSSREIVLIEVEAEGGDENQAAQSLLHYLESRKRYAVVGHNKTRIKDFYLIPLYKTQDIPDCLYVVRVEDRKKRPVDVFLGVLVLTKQKLQPHQQVPSLVNAAAASTVAVPSTNMDTIPTATTSLTAQTTVSTAAAAPPLLPPELQFLQHLPQLAQLTSQQQPILQQQQTPQPYTPTTYNYQAAASAETASQQQPGSYQPYYGYQASTPATGRPYRQAYSHSHRLPPAHHHPRQRNNNNNNRRHHQHHNSNSNNNHRPPYR